MTPRRHRLVVVAPCTVEVVRRAGGWLFDRVMAGWDATVLVADHTNARPLRILGAGVANLETALSVPPAGVAALSLPPAGPAPQAMAVEADLYEADERVRRLVRHALDAGTSEVWLWGDRRPAGGSVQHRLSVAARAFKAAALTAASDASAPVAPTELFHWRRERSVTLLTESEARGHPLNAARTAQRPRMLRG